MRGTLAVVSQSGHFLSFFDLDSGERVAHLDIVAEPHELCYDSKRNLLYVSHTYRHGHYWDHGEYAYEISIVDCAKKQVVGTIDVSPCLGPHGLAVDEGNYVLYASVEHVSKDALGGVIGIDLDSHKVVKRVESQYASHWFAITPDAKKAYTCNKTASFISVLDMELERMIGKIDVPAGCEEPGVSLDGKHVYFPTPGFAATEPRPDPKLEVIDTASDQIVSSIKLDQGAQAAHVTARSMIMVGQYGFEGGKPTSGRVAVYDGETHEMLGNIDVGGMTLTLRSSPDGSIGFAANIFANTVTVIDLDSMTVVQKISMDSAPRQGAHGMAFIP